MEARQAHNLEVVGSNPTSETNGSACTTSRVWDKSKQCECCIMVVPHPSKLKVPVRFWSLALIEITTLFGSVPKPSIRYPSQCVSGTGGGMYPLVVGPLS